MFLLRCLEIQRVFNLLIFIGNKKNTIGEWAVVCQRPQSLRDGGDVLGRKYLSPISHMLMAFYEEYVILTQLRTADIDALRLSTSITTRSEMARHCWCGEELGILGVSGLMMLLRLK